jgi:hypothetical protein
MMDILRMGVQVINKQYFELIYREAHAVRFCFFAIRKFVLL